VLSCPLLRLLKGTLRRHSINEASLGEYTALLPLSPPLSPAAAITNRGAPVVFIVMLKGCIFKASRSLSLSNEVSFFVPLPLP
jgi:hypothetical protein